jgi:hypothetical protein
MYNIIDEDDGDILFEFSTKEEYDEFLSYQIRLASIKKKIDLSERVKLIEYLRENTFSCKEHRTYQSAAFKAKMPKWKRKVLDRYVF